MKHTQGTMPTETKIKELQQLSIDAGHESGSYWFEHYLSFTEKRNIKRWCLKNRFSNDCAAHAIQQIRGIKL